jgi:hypothetical protein
MEAAYIIISFTSFGALLHHNALYVSFVLVPNLMGISDINEISGIG